DAELELALGDAVDDALRVRDRQAHVNARIRLGELAEQHGDDRAAGPGRRTELERPGERVLLPDDVLDELLLEGEHPLRRGVQPAPRLRPLHAASGPAAEPCPEALLERSDLQA